MIKERIAKIITISGYKNIDIKEISEMVLYDLRKRRGVSIRGALQHQKAVSISGSRYEGLEALDISVLVIHGKDDPLLPIEHGKKIVEVIPNARGIWLDDIGHVFPFPNMDELMKNIISHLGGEFHKY